MEYSTKEEIQQAIESEKALLVFSAEWCGPCKTYAPVVDEFKGLVSYPVVRVNVDNESDIAQEYGVRGIPTTVLVKNGVKENTLVGVKTNEDLAKFADA